MVDEQSLNQIRFIKARVEDELLNRPGVTGVDIGRKVVDGRKTDELAIRVLVEEKKDVSSQERIPTTIEGVRTDVIERTFEPHILKVPVDEVEKLVPHVDTGTYNPLRSGISIGPLNAIDGYFHAGTLGAILAGNVSGQKLLLSNAHVMTPDRRLGRGALMTQPSRVDGGSEYDIVGALGQTWFGGPSPSNATADCAVASLASAPSVPVRGTSCKYIYGALYSPTIGARVMKLGRTTGHTFGNIDTLDLTTTVDYGGSVGKIKYVEQIGIEVESALSRIWATNGDSGSVVVSQGWWALGLHYAGNSNGSYGVASRIERVINAMSAQVWICPKPKEKEKEKEKEGKDIAKDKETDLLDFGIEFGPERKGAFNEKIFVEARLLEAASPSQSPADGQPLPSGPLEEHLSRLEERAAELPHFIGPESRPDVGSSALRDEPSLESEQAEDAREAPQD